MLNVKRNEVIFSLVEQKKELHCALESAVFSACRLTVFCFLLGLHFEPEDGGVSIIKNVWLFPNCTALQPKRACSL
jgi:hypothetical protein